MLAQTLAMFVGVVVMNMVAATICDLTSQGFVAKQSSDAVVEFCWRPISQQMTSDIKQLFQTIAFNVVCDREEKQ